MSERSEKKNKTKRVDERLNTDWTILPLAFTACVSGAELITEEVGRLSKHLGQKATLHLSQRGGTQSLYPTDNPCKITALTADNHLVTVDPCCLAACSVNRIMFFVAVCMLWVSFISIPGNGNNLIPDTSQWSNSIKRKALGKTEWSLNETAESKLITEWFAESLVSDIMGPNDCLFPFAQSLKNSLLANALNTINPQETKYSFILWK